MLWYTCHHKHRINMSKIYAITVSSGDRESALRSIDFMNRQILKPDMWVIVQPARSGVDYRTISRIDVPYVIVDRDKYVPYENTVAGLELIPSDAVVCVFAEHAWYSPSYIKWAVSSLKNRPAVTVDYVVEYNTNTRMWQSTAAHADLSRDVPCFCFTAGVFSRVLVILGAGGRGDTPWRHVISKLGVETVKVPQAVGVNMLRRDKHRTPVYHEDEPGWHPDDECLRLYTMIGDDIWRYMESDGAVYVFSNVVYPEERKLEVGSNDILVFINNATSIDYYRDHSRRILYRRSVKRAYGEERLGVFNRCVYGCGDYGIPTSFMRKLESAYDWDYAVEAGSTKSPTTGYSVAKYMQYSYPLRKVVLVNFGYTLAKSTHRCPWHNWEFEAEDLASFEHIFTADLSDGDSPELRKIARSKTLSQSERDITGIFTSLGCDQMVYHDYGEVYDKYISYVRGIRGDVAVVLQQKPMLATALVSVFPDRGVYGICTDPSAKAPGATLFSGSRYSADGWADIPKGLSLIIDDGTHNIRDMLAGIPVFLDHLSDDGILMIEDIPSDDAVDKLMEALPGATCYRPLPVSSYGDDRIVVFSKSGKHTSAGAPREVYAAPQSAFSSLVNTVFVEEGSDRATMHDYSAVFAAQFTRLVGRESRIIEIGRQDGAGLRAIRRILPLASVYGIMRGDIVHHGGAEVIVGDGYADSTWAGLPSDFDIVIDDGSHVLGDIRRGIPTFLKHIKPGGTLIIEDISTESDVQAIIGLLPGAVCYRTAPRSRFGDDRIIVYNVPVAG